MSESGSMRGRRLGEGSSPSYKVTFKGPEARRYEVIGSGDSEGDAVQRAVRACLRSGVDCEYGSDPRSSVMELAVEPVASWVPECTVIADGFRAVFEIDAYEPLDLVCDIDVEVSLADGSRWWAVMFTVDEVDRLMRRWEGTGEGGEFFLVVGSLIVRHPGIRAMTDVIAELVTTSRIAEAFSQPT